MKRTLAAALALVGGVALAKCAVERTEVGMPEGNYTVTVVFGDTDVATKNWVKAEGRRLMLAEVYTAPGEFKTESFTVNTRTKAIPDGRRVGNMGGDGKELMWDGRLTLDIFTEGAKPPKPSVEPAKGAVTIFVVGDSTVTDQDGEPWGSWGQCLPAHFKAGTAVANYARSGATLGSLKSSLREDKLFSVAKPGDYLFIQYGHNDQKDKVDKLGNYTRRLGALVDRAKAAGLKTLVISSMERRRFGNDGKAYHTLREMADAARDVAAAKGVPFFDLNARSIVMYDALGPEKSKRIFNFEGREDNTHHNMLGAYIFSRIVLDGARAAYPELSDRIRPGLGEYDFTRPDLSVRVPRSGKVVTEKPDEK